LIDSAAPVRKSTVFIISTFFSVLFLSFLLFIHPELQMKHFEGAIAKEKELVEKLQLTDLCLFTEASYTRNLSLADLHTPFQDFPTALEHFPSGSITIPSPLVLDRIK
jgi:hypothetical protein